jgi:hypothetical protein
VPEEKIVISARDEDIFQFIHEQKYMTADQVFRLFWTKCNPTAGSGRQRLKKLVDADYLKTQDHRIKGRDYRLFLLAKQGLKVLREKKKDFGISEIVEIHEDFVLHTLKLTDIRGLFRELGQSKWASERWMRAKEFDRHWYPDGVIEINGLKVAIELENTYRTKERYQDRLELYAEDDAFTLVIYVLAWKEIKWWLFEMDYPADRIAFVLYDDLMTKKTEAILENKASQIKLGSIL